MSYLTRHYPETRFGGFTDFDGTMAFYSRVNALLDPKYTVLDVGCGRGSYQDDAASFRRALRILKGKVAKVIGIDVDLAGANNPFLDDFHLIEGPSWPVADSSVDLIVADFVLEHVQEPEQFFLECSRVLKSGGYLCIRTTNSWSYVALMARLVPNRYHAKVTARVQTKRAGQDVFPVAYRCNNVFKLRRLLRQHFSDYVAYGYEAEPAYLAFSRGGYALGVLHQKFAPKLIKPTLFAFARKA